MASERLLREEVNELTELLTLLRQGFVLHDPSDFDRLA
jgi:hypothetical protein